MISKKTYKQEKPALNGVGFFCAWVFCALFVMAGLDLLICRTGYWFCLLGDYRVFTKLDVDGE